MIAHSLSRMSCCYRCDACNISQHIKYSQPSVYGRWKLLRCSLEASFCWCCCCCLHKPGQHPWGSHTIALSTAASYIYLALHCKSVRCTHHPPCLQIFIREKKVKVKRMTSLLRDKIQETYRPQNSPDFKCDIEMGFNTENENLYGMMLYHRNRLIRPYHRSLQPHLPAHTNVLAAEVCSCFT